MDRTVDSVSVLNRILGATLVVDLMVVITHQPASHVELYVCQSVPEILKCRIRAVLVYVLMVKCVGKGGHE